MKKIIILVLACAFCSTVNAEIKRLNLTIPKESKQFGERGWTQFDAYRRQNSKTSESIQVDLGQKVELINAVAQFGSKTGGNSELVFVDVSIPEFINESIRHQIDFSVRLETASYNGKLEGGIVFFGPCTISLGLTPRSTSTGNFDSNGYEGFRSFASATFKISAIDDSGSAGRGSNYSLVIPETSGDATLVLESSDDLVSWQADTVGDKPKGNRRKFYRLRAKKN